MQSDIITKQYNSFSGADMVATCTILGQTIALGTLQTISYSVHMDRQPIRSIGNINAKDYTLGPRTIAGSLVFAVFDKHLLYHMIEAYRNSSTNVIQNNKYTQIASQYQSFLNSRHMLADELPPFDVTISFANEYGITSKSALYGVRLVNEGQVMSINDIYTENTYQFVATDLDYMNTGNIDILNSVVEEDDAVIAQEPTVIVDNIEQSNAEFTISHINHDYSTDFSVIKIVKEELEEIIPSNGGVLYVQNPQGIRYGIEIPINNGTHYESVKLTKGRYTLFFKENITDILSPEIDVAIRDGMDSIPPIIDSVTYIDDNNVQFNIKCYSAALHGHNHVYIDDENGLPGMRRVVDKPIDSDSYTIIADTTSLIPLPKDTKMKMYSFNTDYDDSSSKVVEFIYYSIFNYNIYYRLFLEADFDMHKLLIEYLSYVSTSPTEYLYLIRTSIIDKYGYDTFYNLINYVAEYERGFLYSINYGSTLYNDKQVGQTSLYTIINDSGKTEHYELATIQNNSLLYPSDVTYDSLLYIHNVDTLTNDISAGYYVYIPTKEKLSEITYTGD